MTTSFLCCSCSFSFFVTDDMMQRIRTFLIILTGSYKILVATMLSVFIPQANCVTNNCKFIDYFTISKQSALPFVATMFNLVTLISFVIFYIFEYYRENWLIAYLDIDTQKPLNGVKQELENYPEIKEKLEDINVFYYNLSKMLVGVNILNFIVSMVFFIQYFNLESINDVKSITVLITYFLIISEKLVYIMYYSEKSYKEYMPYSAYMYTPDVFNTIDKAVEIEFKNMVNNTQNIDDIEDIKNIENEQ